MPTYEYECQKCGHLLEAFQSISERPLKRCPKCGVLQLKRLISAGSGLLFKGSGFYITDYRSKEYKEKAKTDSDKAKPKETKDKKSESSAKPKQEVKKPRHSSGSNSL